MIDLTKITREEMKTMAVETRKQVTSAVVTNEQFDQYPVSIELLKIPTRVGESDVYFSYKNKDLITPLVINFHGGGFIRARTPSDDLFCRKIVHHLNCKTLDVDYRLAPEHPYPTALHESYDVVKWVFEHTEELGVNPARIVLTGHSAGANFVAGITMMANQSGDFMHALNVIDYPPMDNYTDPEQKEQRSKSVPAERVRLYNLYYCEREHQKDYLVSPLFATEEQLKGFPKTLVITAGEDTLRLEGEQFALKVAQAGGEVTLKRFIGAAHGFTIYGMEGGDMAFDLIVRFIKDGLNEHR